MSLDIKQKRAVVVLLIIFFIFIVQLLVGDILLYMFETNANESISTLNDSFRAIETMFKLSGGDAVYPITTAGRVTVLAMLVFSVILAITFAAQIFSLVSKRNVGLWAKKIEKEIEEEVDDLEEEIVKSQKLEEQILEQQQEIIENEEDIISKLDKLRNKK